MKLFTITSTRNNLSKHNCNGSKNLEFHIKKNNDDEEVFQYIVRSINKKSLRLECNQMRNRSLQEPGSKKRVPRCAGKISVRPLNGVIIQSITSNQEQTCGCINVTKCGCNKQQIKYEVTWKDKTQNGYGELAMDFDIFYDINNWEIIPNSATEHSGKFCGEFSFYF